MLKTIKRILNFSGNQKSTLIKSFIYSIILSVFKVLPIGGIIYSLNCIIKAKNNTQSLNLSNVFIVFLIMAVGFLGEIIFGALANDRRSIACFSMSADKRVEIGERLKRIPMGYFTSNNLGEITSTVTTTIGDIEMMAGETLNTIILGIVHALAISIMISFFEIKIGIISICGILLGLIVNSMLQRKSKIVSPKRQESQVKLVTAVLEYVQGIEVIKSFGLGDKSNKTVDNAIEESCRNTFNLEKAFVKLIGLYTYVFKFASCAIIGFSCYLLCNGELSLVNTLMMLVSSFIIYSSIEMAGSTSSMIRIIDNSITKVEEVLSTPLMDENGKTVSIKNYDIKAENISFSYDKRKIIDNVSFNIPQNTTTAIVGPSGGGKSTLCNLISRFWDVEEGKITIGGEDVRNFTCESLLNNFSMVFQNVYLFQDTILNNIKIGNPNASIEDVVEAAKKACCHDFIMELPDKYNTIVGEGGGSLSGGEKQRISIARAILKKAPIIILDEATSSVDPENESELQKAIEELTKNRTVIMIAHRLSTVRNADQILVVENGRISQRGKHNELYARDGLYRDFIDVRKKAVKWSL